LRRLAQIFDFLILTFYFSEPTSCSQKLQYRFNI
jgi:hypothetical protein